MKTKYDISKATREECIEILSERRLLTALGLITQKELPSYLDSSNDIYYQIRYKNYKLLFTFEVRMKDVYELHVACPSDAIVASRVLCLLVITWLFQCSELYPKAIITTCPEGKIANMVRKLGARQIDKRAGLLYFMMTADQLNLGET